MGSVFPEAWSSKYTTPESVPGAQTGMCSSTDHMMVCPLTSMCSTGPWVSRIISIVMFPGLTLQSFIAGSVEPVSSLTCPLISASATLLTGCWWA